MTIVKLAACLLLLALAASPSAGRAAGAGLRPEKSVYVDARDVPFKAPEGLACDDKGAVVVADTGNARLVTFVFKDGVMSGGTEVKLPQLRHPVRVQLDSRGFAWVLDRRSRQIVKVDERGGYAGVLEVKGASGLWPVAFKLDAADDVYLLDLAGGRVLVVGPGGEVKREVPLPPRPAVFTDIATDGAGKIFALDAVGAVIWAVERGGSAFRPASPGLKDRLAFGGYLAYDRGRLLVVDQNGHHVCTVGQDGTFQSRELSLGSLEGQVWYPAQLCVNRGGDAFLADRNNNRIQVFGTKR